MVTQARRARLSESSRGSHTDWVVRRLRAAITEGVLKPNDRLRAPQLAEEWGISPTPVREAFQRLAAVGFLTYNSHQGVRVAPISLEGLEELMDLRLLVEPEALRRSMERAGDSWLPDVQAALADLEAAYRTKPFVVSEYEEAHREFHATLVSCAGPTWWPQVTTMLLDQASRYRSLNLHLRDGSELISEHEAIAHKCEEGDIDAAVALLEKHIRTGRETLGNRVQGLLASRGANSTQPAS